MSRIWGVLTILLLVASPWVAAAQNTAKLAGTVVDAESGDPLPGATVMIEETTLGAATNSEGDYTIFEVPPGTYTVTASFVGYATVRRQEVEVIGGITNRVDFELSTSELELEVVEVAAERPLVNPTATNAVRRLGQEELAKLPTRDVSTYYSIQPGVTIQDGEVHIRGGRPDETEYLLEGISSRSIMGTDNVIPVIPEALEEIQVYAGGYSAEHGGANAGIVQQVLRTGGSELSGLFQYETDQAASVVGDPVQGYDDLTLTLGGPLGGERVRFFVALNNQNTDNYNPMFWSGADLGTPIDDVTGDSAVAPVQWEEGVIPGIRRPEEQLRVNGTLLFNFHPLRVRLGVAQLTRDRRINQLPIYNMFNNRRLPQREDLRRLVNLQANYFLSDNTYLEATAGFFEYNFEIFDPVFDKPQANGQGGAVMDLIQYYNRDSLKTALGGDSQLADQYTRYWDGAYNPPSPYQFNAFRFARPGDVMTTYQRREQSYRNLSASLTSQQDIHELKLGGDFKRWTIRDYSFRGSALASVIANDASYAERIKNAEASVANTIRRAGYGGIGYDAFMNKVNEGLDDAKHPVTASAYVNDKLEFNDIIVNAGLRWDYYDMDLWTVEDPAKPGFNRSDWTVEGMKEAPAKTVLQPRLGFSFPVTDQTVFHLQYGKFAQMPDMNYVYESRADMATILAGQFFIRNPFAWDLDPIKTTQYEIGLGHQFTNFAAFDITPFYRKTEGQLEIVLQKTDPSSPAANYNVFRNGDFSIARGIEFSLRTRRIGNFRGFFNYTLTDAKGTNSEPSGQVAALEQGTRPPSLVQPLRFEQRHRGSFMLDYSTGPDQGAFAQNWTVNLLLSFNSGHRFTRSTGTIGQRGADEGPLLTDRDPRTRVPLEPLNASTTPWYFNTDVRMEKGFNLGPTQATAYLYVKNLLNARSVLNVYLRTGDAASDGFLTDPELSEKIVEAQGQEYVDYYRAINLQNRQHYIEDWGHDLYGNPREVRLGLRVSL